MKNKLENIFHKHEKKIQQLIENEKTHALVKVLSILLVAKYRSSKVQVIGNESSIKLIQYLIPKAYSIDISEVNFDETDVSIIVSDAKALNIFEQKDNQTKIIDLSNFFNNQRVKQLLSMDMIGLFIEAEKIELLYYGVINILLDNKRYAIYGAGSVGALLCQITPKQITSCYDGNYNTVKPFDEHIKIEHPKKIKENKQDGIIISVLGREEQIEEYINTIDEQQNIIKLATVLTYEDAVEIGKLIKQFSVLHTKKDLYSLSLEKYNDVSMYEPLIFDRSEFPKVSIIIPVYNQPIYTYMTLKSLRDNIGKGISYEIIITDDNSHDPLMEQLWSLLSNVKIVHNESNKGFLLNCNNTVDIAKGEYIVFLNNDVLVQPSWLEALLSTMSDSSVGLVGSKFLFPDGSIQEAGGIIFQNGTAVHYGRNEVFWNAYNVSYLKEVDYVSGASLMISRQLWNEIGGFDERYIPAYCEDVDLAFEVRARGYKVVLQPHSLVIHFEGISHGKDLTKGTKQYQVVNQEKFFDKWKDVLKSEHSKDNKDIFLARDRSHNKQHIVIIDHLIPTYDQDAGSRTIWQYMQLLLKMNCHVTFIPYQYNGEEKYLQELQSMGVECLFPTFSTTLKAWHEHINWWFRKNGMFIDTIMLLRPEVAQQFIQECRSYSKAKIIFHGVDLHHLRMQRDTATVAQNDEVKTMKNLEFSLMNSADVVTTISVFEKKYIQDKLPHKDVRVIPTFMYTKEFPFSAKGYEDRKGLLFVGGFRHLPNIDAILWFVKEVFPLIVKEKPETILYIVGSNPTSDVLLLENEYIKVLGYVSDEELDKLYDNVLVNVAPLRYGAGVKGKVIESIAQGVPIVTTSTGAEGIYNLEKYSNILVESQEKNFAQSVVDLITLPSRWKSIRKEQIKYAKLYLNEQYGQKQLGGLFECK